MTLLWRIFRDGVDGLLLAAYISMPFLMIAAIFDIPKAAFALLVLLAMGFSICVGLLSAHGRRVRERQKTFRAQGLCEKCGYDIRANADRCPECGNPIVQVNPLAPASHTEASGSSAPPH